MKFLHSLKHLFIVIALVSGCSPEPQKQASIPAATPKDSLAPDTVALVKKLPVHTHLNDLAYLIAGIPSATSSLKAHEQTTAWKQYAQAISSNWQKLDTTRLQKMTTFARAELSGSDSVKHIFYPFSGPDFLSVYKFFPHGNSYYLLGLEPVGQVPDTSQLSDTSGFYQSMQQSLFAIVNFSFFRTLSMAVDLKSEQVKGTIPLMMFFLARTNNDIINIRHVNINNRGELIDERTAADSTGKLIKGVEITFTPKAAYAEKKLYYFSADVSDNALVKTPGFRLFTDKLQPAVTYLKSASYLLHKSYFSAMRSTILKNSLFILQDDSGIPLRFFNDSTQWKTSFYGSYDKPIPMFAGLYQQDLKDAYNAKLNPALKPLSFGIGYTYRNNKSNLMLAQKLR